MTQSEFFSLTRIFHELSIVCESKVVPEEIKCEDQWCILGVGGPLEFDLTGILARLTEPLAEAGISIFAISTFDTDYLLVRAEDLKHATDILKKAGHNIPL